jgi:hypothetical protein
MLLAGTGSVSLFYVASQSHRGARGAGEAIVLLPVLFACGMGLSLSTGLAYLAGLTGKSVPFIRTPKDGTGRRRYAAARAPLLAWAEVAIGLYAFVGVLLSTVLDRPAALPFLALVSVGFLVVGGRTLTSPGGPAHVSDAGSTGDLPERQLEDAGTLADNSEDADSPTLRDPLEPARATNSRRRSQSRLIERTTKEDS